MGTQNGLNLGLSGATGTGSFVGSVSPTITTPTISGATLSGAALGTPASGTLTNCTGLPIATGVSGLGTGVSTWLITPSSANLAGALTDETGTGLVVFGTSPTLTTPTINGVDNGSSAGAGVVGQVISSVVIPGSAISLTNDIAVDVTNISLTAGDWDVYARVGFTLDGATTITGVAGGINTTSATLPLASDLAASVEVLNATLTAGGAQTINLGSAHINVSGVTTVYLIARATFAVNTASAYGAIWARRRR